MNRISYIVNQSLNKYENKYTAETEIVKKPSSQNYLRLYTLETKKKILRISLMFKVVFIA